MTSDNRIKVDVVTINDAKLCEILTKCTRLLQIFKLIINKICLVNRAFEFNCETRLMMKKENRRIFFNENVDFRYVAC